MKRILLAAAAMLFLLASCSAREAKKEEQKDPEPVTSGDYTYLLREDGTAEILSYTGEETDLTIPAEIDGVQVASIGKEAFSGNKTIETLVIPEGVIGIGNNAFCGCNNIRQVSLPDTLKRISMYAFSVILELEQITVPASVEELGIGAFSACSALSSVTFLGDPEVIEGNPFTACDHLSGIVLPDGSRYTVNTSALIDTRENRLIGYLVGYGLASYAQKNDIHYTVPDGIEIIGASAFYHCRELTEVVLPEGVSVIERSAFSWCSKLTRILIPESVKEIEARGGFAPFEGSENLTAIVWQGSYAESYCSDNGIAFEYASNPDD